MSDKTLAELRGEMAPLRPPVEIGIEYTLLAVRMMRHFGHSCDEWQAALDGPVLLYLECAICGATCEMSRLETEDATYMALTLPEGLCPGQVSPPPPSNLAPNEIDHTHTESEGKSGDC
jgi:hypothetical protein